MDKDDELYLAMRLFMAAVAAIDRSFSIVFGFFLDVAILNVSNNHLKDSLRGRVLMVCHVHLFCRNTQTNC
jgi:hypothetical protein